MPLDIIKQLDLNDKDPNGWSKLYIIEKLLLGYGGDNCFIDGDGQVDPVLGGIALVEEEEVPENPNVKTFDVGPLNGRVVFTSPGETFPYMMWSQESVHTRFTDIHPLNPDHLVGIRQNGANFEHANSSGGWTQFTLHYDDRILAVGNTGTSSVTLFEGTSAFVNGLRLGYIISDFIVDGFATNAGGTGFFFKFGTFFDGLFTEPPGD